MRTRLIKSYPKEANRPPITRFRLNESHRINLVYTPPEYRRQGYATACVAALSQKLLDEGCERCFLLTDLANPTSNHIYREIGYVPVCDWHEYSIVS